MPRRRHTNLPYSKIVIAQSYVDSGEVSETVARKTIERMAESRREEIIRIPSTLFSLKEPKTVNDLTARRR